MWKYLIEQANVAGDRWAVWMTAALFDSVLLLIVFGLVWQLFRKRATPQFGSWLFLLIAARLLSPIEIALPAPVARWAPAALVESWIWKKGDAVASTNGPPAQPNAATSRTVADPVPVSPALSAEPLSLESNQAPLAPPVALATSIEEHSWTLRAPAIAMGIWSLVVALLVVRFARTQWRFRRCVRAAMPIDAGRFPVDLPELCRRAGVNRRIRFVASDRVAVPAVWGILQPTVIVPPGLSSSLDVPHLQWVLLHELAHVRRFDLLFILLENVAAMIQFFNPAIWIANRMANRLREYACDDFALAVSGRSGVDAGEAFVRVLRHASQSRHRWDGALGMFGLDPQTCCLDRVRRMVNSHQPPAAGASRPAWIGLILLSLFAVPCMRGASAHETADRTPPTTAVPGAADPASEQTAAAAKTAAGRQADEKVVGTVASADGRPLAGIEVLAVRANGHREATLVTDQKGEIRLPLAWAREPRYGGDLVNLVAKDANRIGWHQILSTSAVSPRIQGPLPPPKPFQITLVPLDRTVTGHLVDPNGKPLAGVRIRTFQLRNPANGFTWFSGFGMQDELPMPHAVTDGQGKFRVRMPKEAFAQLDAVDPTWVVRHLNLDHADHDLGEVEMVPAGRISGKVVLSDGKPAVGFRVSADRRNARRLRSFPSRARLSKSGKDDPRLGDAQYAVTDAAGKFELGGLYPEQHEVQVEREPQRPDLLASSAHGVAIRAGDTQTVNFALQRGRHVVGRVFEIGSNRPITRVDIFASVSLDHQISGFANGLTNDLGEFEFYALPGLATIHVNKADPDGKQIPGATREVVIAADRDPDQLVFRLEAPKPGLFRPRVVKWANVTGRIGAFAFDSKWERVVTVASPPGGPIQGNQDIRVRRVADGKELARLENPKSIVTDVAFSSDGETIVTAGGPNDDQFKAGEVKIWDAASGELLRTLAGHTNLVLSVACSPDGNLIASGGYDHTVRVWNAETGIQAAFSKTGAQGTLFKEEGGSARSLSFSRDGKTLVAGFGSGLVKFWDTGTFRELRTIKADNLYLFSAALSSDGKRLAASGIEGRITDKTLDPNKGRIHIWDLASGKRLAPIPISHEASSVVFSADGKYVLVAAYIGEIFSAETGKGVGVINRGSVSSSGDKIRISPDGTRMAIGRPNSLPIWDLSGLGQAGN